MPSKVQRRYVAAYNEFMTAARVAMDQAKALGADLDREPLVKRFAGRAGYPSASQLYRWLSDAFGPERQFPSRRGKPNPNQRRVQAREPHGPFTEVEAEFPEADRRPEPRAEMQGDGAHASYANATAGTLIPFVFEGHPVRVVEIDGAPWFVGKDVAERLGYADPTTAIRSHCKGVQKLHPLPSEGGTQNVRVLSEPDVLRLIVGSNLPAAQRFERWVFEEVLPSIRKRGAYIAGQEKVATGEMSPAELMARALKAAEATIREAEAARLRAEAKVGELEATVVAKDEVIERQVPKVLVADRIANTAGTITISEAAKVLGVRPIAALFSWMDNHDWIYSRGKSPKRRRWLANNKVEAKGWLKSVSVAINPEGDLTRDPELATQARVTPAGLIRLAILLPAGMANSEWARAARAGRIAPENQGSLFQ